MNRKKYFENTQYHGEVNKNKLGTCKFKAEFLGQFYPKFKNLSREGKNECQRNT